MNSPNRSTCCANANSINSCRKSTSYAPLRIISLNLNGIRSAVNKGLLPWMAAQKADVVCLQEVKAHTCDLTARMLNPGRLRGHFHCAQRKGYSGVALYCAHQP